MKKLLLLCAFALAFAVRGENQILPGTVLTESVFMDDPTWSGPEIAYRYIGAPEEQSGRMCLPIYRGMEPGDGAPGSYLHIDGDKVYFLFDDSEGHKEWILAYDFSLEPGQGCTIGLVISFKSVSYTYVECVERTSSADYGGFPCMILAEYDSAEKQTYMGKGEWLVGLGSVRGLVYNGYFEADGGASWLLEVRRDGQTICRYKDYADIDSVGSDALHVSAAAGQITVSGISKGQNARVYTIDGRQLHRSGKASDDSSSVVFTSVAPGTYIVSCGATRVKVRL